ncbi:hypothetical protein CLOSTHATH_02964 [Hungatella hathewayi DSM 13479]|uniref:Uncharacterized protein n=1 Tax=Hungatella hathewayi DSM 13479 TaxID=566550 RepID=D3AH76_9FIRM|nr:hypothetical protein CLOSTHATH_02964 [Hungatella hathewayi DSM 13479]
MGIQACSRQPFAVSNPSQLTARRLSAHNYSYFTMPFAFLPLKKLTEIVFL